MAIAQDVAQSGTASGVTFTVSLVDTLHYTVQATAATRDPAFLFDDVTAVDGTLVAIGSSRMADQLVAGGPTAPPTPSEGVWISGDGMTWQLLDEDSSLKLNLNTHIASIGGRVVVATQDVSSVDIYAGNLTR